MARPRPSEAVEVVEAAAFQERKWVWVPDEREGYVSGWVNKEEDDFGEVVIASGGEVRILCVFISLSIDSQSPTIRPVQDEPSKV